MDQGLTNADTPASQLSRLLGVPACDATHMAAGPSRGAFDLLGSEAFRREPPRALVWGFVERSIRGEGFPTWPPQPPRSATARERLTSLWQTVRRGPDSIRRHLTRWSLLRRWSIAIRAEAAWRLAGQLITDKVLIGQRPDGLMLFYRDGVRSLERTAEQRGLDQVAEGIQSVNAECRRRGIHLVVLLVPDKGHVYRRWLKPADRPKLPEPSALDDLAVRLAAKGVHAVNLLPVFLSRSGDGQPLLYYPDDTHWNEDGIRLAMAAVAASLADRGIRP
jgi:hypothetical protein